jgi:hypothetical protein
MDINRLLTEGAYRRGAHGDENPIHHGGTEFTERKDKVNTEAPNFDPAGEVPA